MSGKSYWQTKVTTSAVRHGPSPPMYIDDVYLSDVWSEHPNFKYSNTHGQEEKDESEDSDPSSDDSSSSTSESSA